MQAATRPVWAEIDIDTLIRNIGEVRRVTEPSAEVMAVVKANAYGHGAVQCSRVFLENGTKSLAVATLTEAVELRGAGLEAPILVLGYTPVEHFGAILKWGVTPTIYTIEGARALADVAESVGKVAKAHVKVDTGLGRIGFLPRDESLNAIEEIAQLPSLEIEGIFTHFAVADAEDKEYTRRQFEEFLGFTDRLEARGITPPHETRIQQSGDHRPTRVLPRRGAAGLHALRPLPLRRGGHGSGRPPALDDPEGEALQREGRAPGDGYKLRPYIHHGRREHDREPPRRVRRRLQQGSLEPRRGPG